MLSNKEISIINSKISFYSKFHDKKIEKFISECSEKGFIDEDLVNLFLEAFMYDVAARTLSLILEELLENRRKYA